MNRLEDKIQFACAQWLRQNKIAFFHVPNGAKRSAAEASRLIALGLVPGVHDLWLLLPGAIIIPIELKTLKGSRSKSQKNFHAKITALGFPSHQLQADCPNQAVHLLREIVKSHSPQFQETSQPDLQ